MGEFKETILRDGEIAVLIGDVTVIMNVNTVADLFAKILAPGCQVKEIKTVTANVPKEPDVKSIVPEIIDTRTKKTPSYPNTVFVDNFGNVYATLSEAEHQLVLATGSGYELISGKRRLGYGYPRVLCHDPRYVDVKGVKSRDEDPSAKDYRLVYLVEVPKRRLYSEDISVKDRNALYQKSIIEANNAIKTACEDARVYGKMNPRFINVANKYLA